MWVQAIISSNHCNSPDSGLVRLVMSSLIGSTTRFHEVSRPLAEHSAAPIIIFIVRTNRSRDMVHPMGIPTPSFWHVVVYFFVVKCTLNSSIRRVRVLQPRFPWHCHYQCNSHLHRHSRPESTIVCIPWWRHQMETFSALLAICAGNSPVPVNSPHKGQWRGALMFSLICVWINGWVNNHEAGDLRRNCGHYDVIVMHGSSEICPCNNLLSRYNYMIIVKFLIFIKSCWQIYKFYLVWRCIVWIPRV